MTRLSVLFSAVLLPLAAAISASFNTTTAENSSLSGSGLVEPRQRPGAPEHPILLRIMPLGASITAGVGEDSGNGYRKPLRDKLRWENWKVNYIGSKHDGDSTFHNQAHEGHPGYVVSRVHDTIKLSINRKPNLILINAGTNDANPDNKQVVVTTGQRMDAMLDDLYKMSAGVTIVLSTLIPNGRFDTNVETVNEQYREIVRRRKAAGDKIELAEMHNGFITVDDLRNDPTLTHPDKEGFRKMAAVWYGAIARVADEITAPIDTGIPDDVGDNLCDKKPGGRGPVTTQQGSGSEDGPYVHASQGRGRLHQLTVFFTDLGFPTNQLHMAQLVNAGGRPRGQEVDEIVVIHDKAFTDEYPHLNIPRHSFYLATGTGQWSSDATEFDPGLECLARGVRFGDVNNDGLDDFICINAEGNMYVSINQGGNPPRFKPTANGGLIRTGEPWCTQAGVRLGDIDGDGRLDYCCIDGQGDIYCWRNGGQGDAPTAEFDGYWQPMVGGGPTFDAKGQPGIQGVRLLDINGDFRADWVYVYEDGSTRIFINQRGEGSDGGRLKPHWVEASVAHRGFPGEKPFVLFGRVFGSNRRDYITVTVTTATFNKQWDVNVWENTGSGGTLLRGDGVFYCDMHNQGYDDYLAVEKDGSVTLYSNIQSPPNWGQGGTVFELQGNYGLENVHFGDWDGDGYCDVIVVDQPGPLTRPSSHKWWRNRHDLTFSQGSGAPDLSWCEQIHGVGQFDQHIHFADVDGDGRVDILCMASDGKTYGALNKANGLEQLGQVKVSEGFDRASHRFADVNGDGLADFLWVDKFTGNTQVWYNEGLVMDREANLNSAIKWRPGGKAYGPMDRGYNMHFPALGTAGRADFHLVHPQTAKAETWFNECPNGGGSVEDGDPADPNLPTPPDSDSDDDDWTEIDVPLEIDLPDDYEDLIEQTLGPASPGDVFYYLYDEEDLEEERFAQVMVVDKSEDYPDIDCGVHLVGGEDGNTLSCVADTTAWVYYSLEMMESNEADALERRDTDAQTGHHHVQFHDEWRPRGNCPTVHCMLIEHAPANTWVPIGNGSARGMYHEHHFAKFGNLVGHKVYPGGFRNLSSSGSTASPAGQLSPRDGVGNELNWYNGRWHTSAWFPSESARLDWFRYGGHPPQGQKPLVRPSMRIGSWAEQTVAKTNYHQVCLKLDNLYNRTMLKPGDIGYIRFDYDTIDETPSEEPQQRLEQCQRDFQDQDPTPVNLICYHNVTDDDPKLARNEDFDDDLNSVGPLPWQMGQKNLAFAAKLDDGSFINSSLVKRATGPSQGYNVNDVSTGSARVIKFLAPTYPNGGNGQGLNDAKDNGDTTAYGLENERDCTNGKLINDANTDDPTKPMFIEVVTEHIQPERQNLKNFFEYAQNPEIDLADGNGIVRSRIRAHSFDEQLMWASVPYRQWLGYNLPGNFPTSLVNRDGSFYSDVADTEGSTTNTEVMANLEKNLNGYKARIMNSYENPTADDKFNKFLQNIDIPKTQTALCLLRQGLAVFNYLNTPHILDLQALFYTRLQDACLQYDVIWNKANPNRAPSDMTSLFTEFLQLHGMRIANVHRAYMHARLNQLTNAWTLKLVTSGASASTLLDAIASLGTIRGLKAQVDGTVRFNPADYIFRQPET